MCLFSLRKLFCDFIYKVPELQVLMKVCVVTEVSTFLTITQVGSGLNFLIFSKCLATVKSCVTVGPINS